MTTKVTRGRYYTDETTTDQDPDAELFDFEEAFRANGILWALNRYVLHPREASLYAFFYKGNHDEPGDLIGWQMVRSADGLWAFEDSSDHDGRDRFETFLAYVADRPAIPHPLPEPTEEA